MRRRELLGLAAAAVAWPAATAPAIEPIRRQGRPHMRLSLAAYSFRQALDLKQQEPALTLETFIDMAATQPLDAVELTGYYFPETSPRYLARLKGRATRLGLDINGTAIRNDFCGTNASRLKEQIAHVKSWIEHTARLGGKTMRIFAGSVARGDTEERARGRCVEAVHECCEHAAQFGVFLALENHGGITSTPEQMMSLVRAVRSDWFGVNLDTGNFRTADPYADLARLAPYAVTVQLKTEIQRAGKPKEAADMKRLVQMLRDVNYRGYVALEYEAAEDAKVAVPRHLRTLRDLLA
ncbi:MAG: sugar phosphate isomerase/epimerase [Gemmataceae bacterium]|nr:sugar phosphate isomerase/epimerase [Gemmataceae bacterium]